MTFVISNQCGLFINNFYSDRDLHVFISDECYFRGFAIKMHDYQLVAGGGALTPDFKPV